MPLNCETSIPALIGGVVMPNARFYVRNHFQIPNLGVATFRLTVGMEWTNVVMPSGLTKDTWITSLEIKPSAIPVTHHICISFIAHTPEVKYGVPLWIDKKRDESGSELVPRQNSIRIKSKSRVGHWHGP